MLDVENISRTNRVRFEFPCEEFDNDDDDDIDEIIYINVAGELFETYERTLGKYPNTLLGNRQRRTKFLDHKNGHIFLNRNRQAFDYILYFYQSDGILHNPANIPLQVFMDEMVFFDIGEEVIEKFQLDNGIIEKEEEIAMPKSPILRKLWSFLEYPNSSWKAKVFALASVVVIMLSLVLFVMISLPEFSSSIETISHDGGVHRSPNKHDTWVFIVDTVIITWFTAEFILRLISCPSKLRFFIAPGNIIDFLSVIPYYISFVLSGVNHSVGQQEGFLSLLRVIRVVRVLKLARHSRGLQRIGKTLYNSINELMLSGFVLLILILICGSTIYYSEINVPGTNFTSIPNSAWWAIVSIGTVGYGDMVPRTVVGKLVGGMTVLCGVLMMALPVPSVVSNFQHLSLMEANRKRAKERNAN